MTIRLVYETHATTIDNENGIATGWLPGTLSAAGRRQARELGERRRDVDVVFSSDLARAVETVDIAFDGAPVPRRQDPRLRECDYGSLNGAVLSALESRRRFIDRPFPGGQSYRDVVEQTRAFLQELKSEYDGRRVLVVAHTANRWALQHLLGGVALEDLVNAPFDWRPGWVFDLS